MSEWLKAEKLGYWHWLSGAWLLVDAKGTLQAESIRNVLNGFYPKIHKLVLEFEGETSWSGFGPLNESNDMFDWLRKVWS